MGDVAMIVPVLRAFSVQYPQAKITVVSRSFFKPFFSDIENLHFFEIDVKQKHKGFIGLLRLFSELKQQNITHFADLHNVLRSKIVRSLFRFTGIPVAFVNKARKEKKELTRLENKIFKPLKPITERHAEVFRQLGFPIDLNQPVFPKKTILSQEILSISGEKNVAWIGIAPFAQYDSKVYPLDLMQDVIDILANQKQYKIFLFGGGATEIIKLKQLQKQHLNVILVAGNLSFQNELALISNLDLMVSMDSGNGHIATMLGVKVLTIWGATHPYAGFVPFHQPIENSLIPDRNQFPGLPTSIYGNKKVANYENAMRSIAPAKIVSSVQSLLEG
ncbi:MAG: glycosyltransferase family 9 protein [Flavobacterium sp.]